MEPGPRTSRAPWSELLVLFAGAICASARCGALPEPAPDLPRTQIAAVDVADAHAFAAAQNAFGLDIWRGLRKDHPGNLAISPASIATALTMTYGGARGDTARAMAAAMHLGAAPDAAMAAAGKLVSSWNAPGQPYELAVANRLFGDQALRLRAAPTWPRPATSSAPSSPGSTSAAPPTPRSAGSTAGSRTGPRA